MLNLNNNCVRKYDRTVPNVEFDSNDSELELSKIFNVNINFNYYFGLVLLRLGIEPEDRIMISNYEKNDCSFDCIINNIGSCRIRIERNSNNMEIIVNRDNLELGYVCEKSEVSEVGMRISLGRYIFRYPDGSIFTRYLSRKNAKFVIWQDDSILELELERPTDIELPLYDDNGCYAKYRIDNEQDIIEYLLSLDCNNELENVYFEINRMYITDISMYPYFVLRRYKKNKDDIFKIVDLISFKNGNLDKFGKTFDENYIYVDSKDNWSFEIPSKGTFPVDFSISKQDGRVICSFSCNEECNVESYMNKVLASDIETAYEAKLKIRKLFKKYSR